MQFLTYSLPNSWQCWLIATNSIVIYGIAISGLQCGLFHAHKCLCLGFPGAWNFMIEYGAFSINYTVSSLKPTILQARKHALIPVLVLESECHSQGHCLQESRPSLFGHGSHKAAEDFQSGWAAELSANHCMTAQVSSAVAPTPFQQVSRAPL